MSEFASQPEPESSPEKREVFENERKWLIDPSKLPQNLDSYPSKKLVAGYLPKENGKRPRIRQEGDRYFKVTKGEKSEGGAVTKLDGKGDVEITKDEFEAAWLKTEARLYKTRYYIPFDKYTIELDVYDKYKNDGFYTVEVEFPNSDERKKFIPPDWFGREVTGVSGYSSRDLAVKGLPDSFKK